MRMYLRFLLYFSLVVLLMSRCRKDQKPSAQQDYFTLTINGSARLPSTYSAIYFSDWHQLFIKASNDSYNLDVGINTDSVSLLRHYLLQGNGDNEAILKEGNETYYSSLDEAEIGGSFELIKFDTINKRISGRLNFIAYSSDKSGKKVISSGVLQDVAYSVPRYAYNGNSAECTIQGKKTTEWHSKDIFTQYVCDWGNAKSTLELDICSIIGYYPNHRYIGFKIPLELLNVGIFQVYPQLLPTHDCQDRRVTTFYNLGNYFYTPVSGTLHITYVNTALKKLMAEFDIVYKDPVTQNTIHIENGKLNLNTW